MRECTSYPDALGAAAEMASQGGGLRPQVIVARLGRDGEQAGYVALTLREYTALAEMIARAEEAEVTFALAEGFQYLERLVLVEA